MEAIQELNRQLGNPDIYLLDLLLKNYFTDSRRILDAGCGEGRNIYFLAGQGLEVYGLDRDPVAIKMIRMYLRPVPEDHFSVADLESIPFPPSFFDTVICSAVLHFARDESHFMAMCDELTRVTSPGGKMFLRMASVWGLRETSSEFPFYLNDARLKNLLNAGWELNDPLKSVWVNGKRSMSVLSFRRL